uniref:Uncharacterized protein n=1 Tax=Cacopsylla melanoneura TaxID=428564 RepID=A0A8D9B8B6_9HEMI
MKKATNTNLYSSGGKLNFEIQMAKFLCYFMLTEKAYLSVSDNTLLVLLSTRVDVMSRGLDTLGFAPGFYHYKAYGTYDIRRQEAKTLLQMVILKHKSGDRKYQY